MNEPNHSVCASKRSVRKGADLVVQMHDHPTGKEETDRSQIGLSFVKRSVAESLKERAKRVGSIWMASYDIDIPAGEKRYARSSSYTLPKEVLLVGVVPHMHLLGKSMKVTATFPDGIVQTLVDIRNWNDNWQDEYSYERPFRLPARTRLAAACGNDGHAPPAAYGRAPENRFANRSAILSLGSAASPFSRGS